MKKLLTVFLFLLPVSVYGQSSSLNLQIPNSQQSYQQDRIRSGDFECSMAIGSSTYTEFGVVGILNENDPTYNLISQDPNFNYDYDHFMRDIGVYGKIVIPIGAPKERLNCNAMYQLELRKRRLEVERLEAELNNIKQLQFEQ